MNYTGDITDETIATVAKYMLSFPAKSIRNLLLTSWTEPAADEIIKRARAFNAAN